MHKAGTVALLAGALMMAMSAKADTITAITDGSSANDTADFANFSGSSMTSTSGIVVTAGASGNSLATCDPYSCDSAGYFPGYNLYNAGSSAITFTFSSPVSSVGTSVITEDVLNNGDGLGVVMSLYNGATLLGTVSANAQNPQGYGPVYIGATDSTGANITSVVLTFQEVSDSVSYEYTYADNAGHTDPNFCTYVSVFNTTTQQGINDIAGCPQKASSHVTFPVTSSIVASGVNQYVNMITVNNYSFSGTAADQSGYFAQLDLVDNGPVSVTPEPSSLALLGTGVLGAAGMMRRRFAGRK